ncbi:MAG: HD domain-containing protein [Planctomycetota bacterium]
MLSHDKQRQQIAYEAARLLYWREESEYFQAKQKAARRVVSGWIKKSELPSNAEVRHQVQTFARLHETSARDSRLVSMRIRALWYMRQLAEFQPRLIGSVLSGGIREGSDIDLHLFANHVSVVTDRLDSMGVCYDVETKRLVKEGQVRVFEHVHIRDEFPVELTVYAKKLLGHRFKSSITGRAIDRVTEIELKKLIEFEHERGPSELEQELAESDARPDRWALFAALLIPLERVMQSPQHHPEGDALYHSLQVFTHAKERFPYDEDFLLAALLHDVGKALDPGDHVTAGLEALDGFISPRTTWLIEHHMLAHKWHDRTLGHRARRRLVAHELHEELLALGECDRAGRECGVVVPSLDEALDWIAGLSDYFG